MTSRSRLMTGRWPSIIQNLPGTSDPRRSGKTLTPTIPHSLYSSFFFSITFSLSLSLSTSFPLSLHFSHAGKIKQSVKLIQSNVLEEWGGGRDREKKRKQKKVPHHTDERTTMHQTGKKPALWKKIKSFHVVYFKRIISSSHFVHKGMNCDWWLTP